MVAQELQLCCQKLRAQAGLSSLRGSLRLWFQAMGIMLATKDGFSEYPFLLFASEMWSWTSWAERGQESRGAGERRCRGELAPGPWVVVESRGQNTPQGPHPATRPGVHRWRWGRQPGPAPVLPDHTPSPWGSSRSFLGADNLMELFPCPTQHPQLPPHLSGPLSLGEALGDSGQQPRSSLEPALQERRALWHHPSPTHPHSPCHSVSPGHSGSQEAGLVQT